MSERPKIRINPKGKPKVQPAPTQVIPPEVKEVSPPIPNIVDIPKEQAVETQTNSEAPPTKRNLWKWISIGQSAVLILILGFLLIPSNGSNDAQELTSSTESSDQEQRDTPTLQVSTIEIPEGAAKREDILGNSTDLKSYLLSIGLPSKDVDILKKEGMKFGLNKLRTGDKVTMIYDKAQKNNILQVYLDPKSDPYTYYLCRLDKDFGIEKLQKHVETKINNTAALVEGTLGSIFIDRSLNLKLVSELEAIYAWTIDFFDVKAGDRFKIMYEEEFINGRAHKINKIIAVMFEKDKNEHYAFNFNSASDKGFFDEHGRSLKKSFLSTPIKYGGVITSGFGLRTHPVTGHSKMHLGTDYAAEEGTEIQSVADGVISIANFKNNNGNYVKIRHDKTYETQYLHMQGFAPGIRAGARVKQGELIGFVGSTGMSTGPHVCFRFWKNKKQVNPTQENAATSSSVSGRILNEYLDFIEPLKSSLDKIEYL